MILNDPSKLESRASWSQKKTTPYPPANLGSSLSMSCLE